MAVDKSLFILVVDSNPSMRRITNNMLRDLGFANYQEAIDGESALQRIVNDRVELVVCEWTLSGLSGLDLLGKLRFEAPFATLPFLFLTSEGAQENIIQAAQAGASGFLVRPLSAAKLGGKIEEIMRNAARAKGVREVPAEREPAPEPVPEEFVEQEPLGEGRLQAIIRRQSILTYFHPIVSVLAGAVIGFEAFSRGRLAGEVLYPDELFELAEQEDLLRPLDMLCRKMAVANFRPLHRANQNIFLALNVNSEGVRRGEIELEDLAPLCRAAGLGPGNVALEIDESAIEETDYLYRFVTGLREQGFLIVFDNVGRRHIHFGAISALQPDVIKLNRLLVRGVDESFAKRQTLRAVVNIAGKAGAAVVAMGVEREEEALACLEHDVHLMQGYFFSRPTEERNVIKQCYALAEALGKSYGTHSRRKISRIKSLHAEVGRRMEELAKALAQSATEEFDQILQDFLTDRAEMDSVYVIDETGRQVTEGLHNGPAVPLRKRLVTRPHYRGENHAFKEYYHYLMSGYDRFSTESFASTVSGRLCKTLCRAFRDNTGARYILCADMILEHD